MLGEPVVEKGKSMSKDITMKNSMTWTGITQREVIGRLSKKEELMTSDAGDVRLISFGTLNAMLRLLDSSGQGLQILKEK